MQVTKTFKVSGALTGLAIALLILSNLASGEGPKELATVLLVFAGSVFFVSAFRHVARQLLWRVGSRLFVSYLLIGVVPIPFFLALAYLGCMVIAGQLAARRVEAGLIARQAALERAALEILPAFARAKAGEHAALVAAGERAMLVEAAPTKPLGAGWAYADASGAVVGEGPLEAATLVPRPWLSTGRSLGRTGEKSTFLTGAARSPAGTLVLYLPIDAALEDAVLAETGIEVRFNVSESRDEKKDEVFPDTEKKPGRGFKFKVSKRDSKPGQERTPGAPELKISGPIRGRWIGWVLAFQQPIVDWKVGQPLEKKERVYGFVRTSLAREASELFGGTRLGDEEGESIEAGTLVYRMMMGVGGFVLFVELIAALLAAFLVMRIARATKRLSLAFAEVEKGNFAHRARLSGRDQLARLIAGFNDMAAHLAESVVARAEKERLRQELEVARQLQRRLLPPPTFSFPGVEIATDFRPAAEIGGDFYHFVGEDDERLVVVVADVSGHGLPTGIVMASAKAALDVLCSANTPTARIFETLDREIRETTEARTFVTLAHVRFRLRDGEIDFTNAGQLYPYRVTPDGKVSSVANPARPLGVVMPGEFRTVTAPTAPGDLWVMLSDGIVEALSPEGEPFGFERLEKVIATGAGGTAAALRDAILAAWSAHARREVPEDDRTLVVLRMA